MSIKKQFPAKNVADVHPAKIVTPGTTSKPLKIDVPSGDNKTNRERNAQADKPSKGKSA